jgi:DNA-binding response OmpR family regulator
MPLGKILIIDNDHAVCDMLSTALVAEGYELLIAHDGKHGLELVRRESPDLIILEARLPDIDGFSLCHTIRFENTTPIMLLTNREAEADRILGLDLGADDYIIKPFFLGELLARVRVRLRRGLGKVHIPEHEVLTYESLQVDIGRRRVFRDDVEMKVVPKEFDILVCLMRNGGMVLSRDILLQQVWGHDFKHDPRTVDVHISWLRTKIEVDPSNPRYIQTVRGRGYRFADGVRRHLSGTTVREYHV